MSRDRRETTDPRLAALEASTPAAQPPPGTVRRRAEWESYALDNEPIGTVHYEPPPTRQDN
jgi:hypothetical protein